MIQVGSFRTNAQADELRARLAFNGIEAGIQRVSDDKGQTWHRVRIGPFAQLQQVQDQMARLEAQKMGGMVFSPQGIGKGESPGQVTKTVCALAKTFERFLVRFV